MFERYTEKARHVIFFARYEASQFGSPEIDTEHLLLGLLREERGLVYRWVPNLRLESVRKQITERSERRDPIPTNVDLPLGSSAKKALNDAADEADRLRRKHIGTEHLLLGLLDEANSFAAALMREAGADVDRLRLQIAQLPDEPWATQRSALKVRSPSRPPEEMVEIHNSRLRADHVRDRVTYCHEYNWHWQKKAWVPKDVAVNRQTGRFTLNLDLASMSSEFELVKDGWKQDHCVICEWELFECSDPERGTGYTNGRDWLCSECYDKFVSGPGYSTKFNVDPRA
jgi:hypothetical protein